MRQSRQLVANDIKRLLVFVGHYPSPYKPYYDTQLIDLLRAGCDVTVVAAPPLDEAGHEKARSAGILDRTRYYPVEASAARASVFAKLALRPLHVTRFMARSNGAPIRRKVGDLLRSLALPSQKPDAILVHGLGVAITFDWLHRWYVDVPMALYYHGGEVASVGAHHTEQTGSAFQRFDVVFTNTQFSRQQAIARGCPAEKVRVLPVGFDLGDYRPAEPRRYRGDGVLRLLSLGRLSEEKGLSDALRALQQVVASGRDRVRLSFAGDGYLRSRLEAESAALGLQEHVDFLGALSGDQVSEALERSDALILSSYAHGTWTETQACAVQEAMLMKALVVTTKTGGVPESIPDAMRRFSVSERDVNGLARAITSIYDMSAAEMAALAEEGRSFVQRGYDIRALNQDMLMELWACSHTS